MAICVTLTMGIGLLVALLMRKLTTWVRLVLTACLIAAWSMPLMVAASIFRFMADSDYGLINTLIAKVVGEDWLGHNWYLNPVQGFGIITLLVVWGAIPFVVVTLYAALTQVPRNWRRPPPSTAPAPTASTSSSPGRSSSRSSSWSPPSR